jgi:protein AbiQ
MDKLKLYNITDEYIDYLRKFEKKVFSNKQEDRLKERKYLGVILKVKKYNYFVPLSSPKDSDYKTDKNTKEFLFDNNGRKIIRKTVIPIMRIISKDINGYDELKGTLKFSNMIPVPECALVEYDVEKEKDENYKILILKELSFIFSNARKIINNGTKLYEQKISDNKNIPYLRNTVDFLLLEEKCLIYMQLYTNGQTACDSD